VGAPMQPTPEQRENPYGNRCEEEVAGMISLRCDLHGGHADRHQVTVAWPQKHKKAQPPKAPEPQS
jgi:hypothetical protein